MEDCELVKDSKVKLYTGKPILNKRRNIYHREKKVEAEFRLIVIKNKKNEYRVLVNSQ